MNSTVRKFVDFFKRVEITLNQDDNKGDGNQNHNNQNKSSIIINKMSENNWKTSKTCLFPVEMNEKQAQVKLI